MCCYQNSVVVADCSRKEVLQLRQRPVQQGNINRGVCSSNYRGPPALAELRRCYPTKTIPAPSGYLLTRWGLDPYALGSYSYIRVGSSPSYREELGRPWNSLVFAGEAISTQFPATMQGAFRSGEEAANKLMAL